MVRPKKADRGSIAKTHVRISLATKRLIDELRQKHGFTTTDQVLQYYLLFPYNAEKPRSDADAAATTTAAANEYISSISKDLYHQINKSGPSQQKSKPVHNKRSWQRRQPKF